MVAGLKPVADLVVAELNPMSDPVVRRWVKAGLVPRSGVAVELEPWASLVVAMLAPRPSIMVAGCDGS